MFSLSQSDGLHPGTLLRRLPSIMVAETLHVKTGPQNHRALLDPRGARVLPVVRPGRGAQNPAQPAAGLRGVPSRAQTSPPGDPGVFQHRLCRLLHHPADCGYRGVPPYRLGHSADREGRPEGFGFVGLRIPVAHAADAAAATPGHFRVAIDAASARQPLPGNVYAPLWADQVDTEPRTRRQWDRDSRG